MKTPHKFVFFFNFYYTIGEMKILDKRNPPGGVSPKIITYIKLFCNNLF